MASLKTIVAVKNRNRTNSWTDKAAGKIAGFFLGVQKRFSDAMNRIVAKASTKKLKFGLVIFCLLSGGFSVYLIVSSIIRPGGPGIKVNKIDIPIREDQSVRKVADSANFISDAMYQNIQRYKRYMDSMGFSIRPGLLDSIKELEDIYHSQKIK